jgi:hypothetical protein
VAPNALTFASSLTGTSSTYNGSAAVTVGVANSGVTAGTYGSSTTTSVITVGVDGRVTAASSSGINLPSGGANEIVVQTSANNTGFISAPSVTNTFLEWNGTGFAWAAASGATTAQALTFNNGGAGAASGTTFNGSVAETISYNTLGAPSATGTGASGTWGISISGVAATTSQTNFSDLTINTSQVLSAANFNSYAPTLTGTGASGTWSINISGTAATATLATASTNIEGGAANELPYQTGANATGFIAAPSTSGTYLEWTGTGFGWSALSGGVTSFSAGTTGFTPSSATTGAITLGGTLNVASGGTGLNSLTAGEIPYGNGTGAFASSANLYFSGTNLGIGTSTPAYNIDVYGASSVIGNSYTDGNLLIGGFQGTTATTTVQGSAYTNFTTYNGSGFVEIMRVTDGLSVGTTTSAGAGNILAEGTGTFIGGIAGGSF